MKSKNFRQQAPVLAAISFFAMSLGSQAASNTWLGTTNNDWDTTTNNWTSPTAWANGNDAVFGTTGAGTITVGSGVTAHNLDFNANGYTIQGGGLTLVTATPTITTATGVSATISSVLSGTVGLTKAGAGTLLLSGANLYTGNTSITGGTLQVNGSGSLGASASYAGTITLTSGTNFNYASTATQTLTGTIGGSGGTFTVSSGTVKFNPGSADKWGGGLGLSVGTGATFEYATSQRLSAGAMNITGAGTFKYSGTGTAFMANGGNYQAINMSAGGKLWVSSGTLSDINVKTTNLGDLQLDGIFQQPLANDVYFNSFNGASTGQFKFSTTGNGFGLRVGVNNGDGKFAGVISDTHASAAAAFTKVGTGTQVLSGANTYRGATNVQNGVLQLGGADNRLSTSTVLTLGNLTTSGKLILGSMGVSGVTDSKSDLTVAGLQTSGSGTTNAIVGGNTSVSTLTVNQTTTTTFAGVLGGASGNENKLALTKTGAGSLTLSGANTYIGGTTLTTGTLALSGSGTLGSTSGTLAVNGGTLNLGSTTQTVGAVTLGGGTISTGTLTGTSYASTGGTISANLGSNSATLTQTSGTTILSGANSYTGTTSVNGGTLRAGASTTVFGNNSAVTVGNGGTLDINGFTVSIGSLAGGSNNTAKVTLGGGTLTAGGNNTTTTFGGSLEGTGTFIKTGSGMMLMGASDYSANVALGSGSSIDIQQGSIRLEWAYNKSTWATNKADLNIASGATFDIWDYGNNSPFNYVKIDSLTGGGVVQRGISGTTTGGLEIGVDNGSGTFSGVIQNGVGTSTVNLIKSGTGTQTLSGINTYTGTTTIRQGTLALGSSGTISSTLVLGASGGTVGSLDVTAKALSYTQANLSGSGTINIGTGKTFNVSTALAPGFSAGTLDVTGSLALAGSTTTTMELAGNGGVAGTDSDFVNVTETITLDGILNIVSFGGYSLGQIETYNLFDATMFAGDFVSVNIGGNAATFSANVWSTSFGGYDYSFNETNGVLTVVPEPASVLLGGIGVFALLRRRRA